MFLTVAKKTHIDLHPGLKDPGVDLHQLSSSDDYSITTINPSDEIQRWERRFYDFTYVSTGAEDPFKEITQASNALTDFQPIVYDAGSWRDVVQDEVPTAMVIEAGDPNFKLVSLVGGVYDADTTSLGLTPAVGDIYYWDTDTLAYVKTGSATTVAMFKIAKLGASGLIHLLNYSVLSSGEVFVAP